MNWLAIETSSPQVSLALGNGATVLREVAETGNASALIERLYRRLEVRLDTIRTCVIGQGPGSYNGLRVGYAFLKGLLCLDPAPVAEVPTPLTLASLCNDQLRLEAARILVLNNARRGEVYAAVVRIERGLPRLEWELVARPAAVLPNLPADLAAIASFDYSAGDLSGFSRFRFLQLFPSAARAGQLACSLTDVPKRNLQELQPRYVRAAVPPAETG